MFLMRHLVCVDAAAPRLVELDGWKALHAYEVQCTTTLDEVPNLVFGLVVLGSTSTTKSKTQDWTLKGKKIPPHLPLSKEPCSPRRRSSQPQSAHVVYFFWIISLFLNKKIQPKNGKCPFQL
jgi:hypothetical protein